MGAISVPSLRLLKLWTIPRSLRGGDIVQCHFEVIVRSYLVVALPAARTGETDEVEHLVFGRPVTVLAEAELYIAYHFPLR